MESLSSFLRVFWAFLRLTIFFLISAISFSRFSFTRSRAEFWSFGGAAKR
jgi:hypothetical protein